MYSETYAHILIHAGTRDKDICQNVTVVLTVTSPACIPLFPVFSVMRCHFRSLYLEQCKHQATVPQAGL